jgi:hypothetical protein
MTQYPAYPEEEEPEGWGVVFGGVPFVDAVTVTVTE